MILKGPQCIPVAKSTRRSFRKHKEASAEEDGPYQAASTIRQQTIHSDSPPRSAPVPEGTSRNSSQPTVEAGSLSQQEAAVILERSSLERPANITATVQWSYEPSHATDICVEKGEKVRAFYKAGEWLHVENKSRRSGFVPFSYCIFEPEVDSACEPSGRRDAEQSVVVRPDQPAEAASVAVASDLPRNESAPETEPVSDKGFPTGPTEYSGCAADNMDQKTSKTNAKRSSSLSSDRSSKGSRSSDSKASRSKAVGNFIRKVSGRGKHKSKLTADEPAKDAPLSEAFKNKVDWYSDFFLESSGESSDDESHTPTKSKPPGGQHRKLQASASVDSNLGSASQRSRSPASLLLNEFQQKELEQRLAFASNYSNRSSCESLSAISKGYAQIRKLATSNTNLSPTLKSTRQRQGGDESLVSPLKPILVSDSKPRPSQELAAQAPPEPCLKKVRMLVAYDFIAEEENDVTVLTGQYVEVLDKTDEDWWWVRTHDGRVGFAPRNFLAQVPTLPSRKPELMKKLLVTKTYSEGTARSDTTVFERDSKSGEHLPRLRSLTLDPKPTLEYLKMARVAPTVREIIPTDTKDEAEVWKENEPGLPLPTYEQYLAERLAQSKVPYCELAQSANSGLRVWRSQESVKYDFDVSTDAGPRILRRKSSQRSSQKRVRFSTPNLESSSMVNSHGQDLQLRQFGEEITLDEPAPSGEGEGKKLSDDIVPVDTSLGSAISTWV